MKQITKVTKLDIYDLFYTGFDIVDFFDTTIVKYNYWGRVNELDFIKRLYDLSHLPSYDPRFKNAEDDIRQHTINNDDYEFCWVFKDDRFSLLEGDDEVYLNFLCEIFHPEVRVEKSYWKEIQSKINELLKNDGYEFFVSQKISGREVYGWRVFNAEEDTLFLPFSQRNSDNNKFKKLSLAKKCREQLYKLILANDEIFYETTETGWNYEATAIDLLFKNITQFYEPKSFDKNSHYVETHDIQSFICDNHAYCVLDALELFSQITTHTDFEAKVNILLKSNSISFRFENSKIVDTCGILQKDITIATAKEAGLKELIQEAFRYKETGELAIAVEKMWDALERLKTNYTNMDKKDSVDKIIKNMSNGESAYEKIFSDEFRTLTTIGNTLRIRHHEMNRVDITDNRHQEYFFNRCYALLNLALNYLK